MIDRQKIAVVHLNSRHGSEYRLNVWLSDNGALSYYLKRPNGGQDHAISNLQLKRELPHYRRDTMKQTLAAIKDAAMSGVFQWTKTEVAPQRYTPDSPWDDHGEYPSCDWQYEVANNDTRLGYLDWVNAKLEEQAL